MILSKIKIFFIKYIQKLFATIHWLWNKYIQRQLEARSFLRIKSTEEFMEHIEEIQHPYFQRYLDAAKEGKPIHQCLINYLQLDFKGKKILDIGPGLGAFLDLARDAGAKSTEFYDSDPLFWRYLKFNGHKGWVLNYKLFTGFFPFNLLNKQRYDVILSRGSINGDDFNHLFEKRLRRQISFPHWLKQVESMAATNGEIIITPTYRSENPKWTCKEPDKFRLSPFFKTLIDSGYEVLPIIEGYGNEEIWPFTFYKRISAFSQSTLKGGML